MKLSASCMACMVSRQEEAIRNLPGEEEKSAFFREVLRTVANAREEDSAPVVPEQLSLLHERFFGTPYSFRELKRRYNGELLRREAGISQEIEKSADPLLAALRFSRVGNYIDFGAMGSVDDEKLDSLLNRASEEQVVAAEYAAFRADLAKASRLAFCADNCGEIVLDRLLLREIRRQYPSLSITVLVRGSEVLNDVTLEDTEEIGLTEEFRILPNGTGIAGTELSRICPEAHAALEEADVIVSKGQGNFETLHGCGLNVYYLFLCKCQWFTQRFGLEQFRGVFVNEKNQKIR